MQNERFEKMPAGFKHWNQQTGKFEHVCDCCGVKMLLNRKPAKLVNVYERD